VENSVTVHNYPFICLTFTGESIYCKSNQKDYIIG